MKLFFFFLFTSLTESLICCTYCATQDSSSTLNLVFVPLGILITLPFGLFVIFVLYIKNFHNVK